MYLLPVFRRKEFSMNHIRLVRSVGRGLLVVLLSVLFVGSATGWAVAQDPTTDLNVQAPHVGPVGGSATPGVPTHEDLRGVYLPHERIRRGRVPRQHVLDRGLVERRSGLHARLGSADVVEGVWRGSRRREE